MLSQIAIAALLSVPALAVNPAIFARDHGADACADMYDDGTNGNQCYSVDINYYSDDDCLTEIDKATYTPCLYTYCDMEKGTGGCIGIADLPSPYYAKLRDWSDPNVQVFFTLDQSCPPSGPAAVFASLQGNDACVEVAVGGTSPGVTVFTHGGSDLARRDLFNQYNASITAKNEAKAAKKQQASTPPAPLKKRDPQCKGFTTTSQESSYSASVQVSDIVNCQTSSTDSCGISTMVQHTESISTSYSLSAGGGIEGIFDIGATFGMEYTESTTTGLQSDYVVDAGQAGYLSSFCAGTLFHGTFTDCDDGVDKEGSTLALKENGVSYVVINTGTA